MLKIKSFQRRIFLALLAVGLLPAILLLLAGTGAVHWVLSSTGTAGPWGSVAESGQALLDQVEEAEVTDPDMVEAADTHRLALSESLRNSQILTLVADRILALLPLMAVALVLVVGGLAYLAARQLSRGFSRPIQDLVGWTNLIAKGQPLPAPGPADTRGVQEFAALRGALRKMAHELEKGRMRMAAVTATRSQAEDVREAGKVLMEEISRLDEMARTFSQFGRMPEGPPARVDLLELLQGLVSQHQGIGPPIQFESPSPLPPILGHFDALQRCFRNLLLNAIDAARDHGRVEVRSWAEGGEVVTEILDRGPGIPPEALDRVWDPDFTTKSSGTGLGLPLVRQTILAHHGRVEGRNHPEGGAVFRVVLPVNPPDQGPTTTP
jgi:signal transduction histidine kinase